MQNSMSNPLEISTKFKNPLEIAMYFNTPWKMEKQKNFQILSQNPWNLLKLLLTPCKILFKDFTPWNFPMLKGPGNFLFFLMIPWKFFNFWQEPLGNFSINTPQKKFIHHHVRFMDKKQNNPFCSKLFNDRESSDLNSNLNIFYIFSLSILK